ncbi:MAG: M1 family aminopeptidase [Vicinamibacterales bacterium]|nr:M1 family aminopeptidase [Vicinamibacterales bacterium]
MPTVILLAALLVTATPALAQPSLTAPGVSLALAEDRARRVSDLRYDLALEIPRDQQAPITGTLTLRFQLTDASGPLVVDFDTSREHVHSLAVNGGEVAIDVVDGHIVLPAAALEEGANEVHVAFTAGDAPLNRNPDFLYALFVPARARQALPVFDQPDLKGRWTMTLTVPSAWQAVANGAETGRTANGETVTVRFAETEPLPTYLVAFVAGDFQVETATRGDRTFRMFHRETDAEKVARNREAIFDLHATALDYMERYTDLPYAFGKFDFVLIPAFQFGGMEHAGKILYSASSLLLDESATQSQQLGRASLIAHETAHMWFGDLVTMQWFNDVWMKEVFANFMAAKIVNPSFPEVNHDLRFVLSHYPAAYDVDRTGGANPIRQPLANLNEAGSLYGAIIYQKAPIVMRHLEDLMGEVNFRDGLREYLERYAFRNATWSDLIAILDERTPMDLAAWSQVWVEEFGRPVISTDLAVADGRITRLAFRQRDYWDRAMLWPQQLRVAIGDGTGVRLITVPLNGPEALVSEATGLPAPHFVLPNGAGWGYGAFALDPASLAYLSTSLPEIPDALTRGAAWVTMWDALLEQAIRPAAFVDLALAALARETDELNRQRVLGYLGNAWWRFLTPEARAARAAAVEQTLRDGLARAETASQKSAWFGALRTVATTPATVAWLREVWAKTETVPGLPLAEADFTTLALELAVREVRDWSGLLATEHARIENPDRKARFAFVMPALSADPAVRARWFDSLRDVEHRRREPWVLEGLSYLHHPLRAAASAQFIEPSLDLLWEIQKTGDIFFPKRWLDQTFSGHSSAAAAETIERFLERLPANYPPRLKQIILQSADDTFRAATILAR